MVLRMIIGLGLTVVAFALAGQRLWWLKRLALSGQPAPERLAYAKDHFSTEVTTQLTEVVGQRKLLKWSVPGAAHAATSMAGADAGRALWRHTELTVGDVDVAGIYDGFTILTVVWLEALGVYGKGEAGPFVEGGKRIARDGQFPLNTGGGQLSAGRLHGFGHLHEVCLQLRGEAGERQVPGGPSVGLVAAGGGELGGALLLTGF